jgi:hypothetical protein
MVLLSFTEWYEVAYEEKWHEDYALLYGLTLTNEYEHYCEINKYEPIWNA